MPRAQPLDEPVSVCPFRIVVDTREQIPWLFGGLESSDAEPLIVPLIRDRHLDAGDYSIDGLEKKITIERKNLSDWYGSIGGNHQVEEAKAARMAAYDFAAYVIEADWQEMFACVGTQITPASIRGTITAWSIRYGIHFFPMPSRRDAEIWCFRLLEMFWRQEQKKIAAIEKAMAALASL